MSSKPPGDDYADVGGQRCGHAVAMATHVQAALASGFRVQMWTKGEFVEVVGVSDIPDWQGQETAHPTNPEVRALSDSSGSVDTSNSTPDSEIAKCDRMSSDGKGR